MSGTGAIGSPGGTHPVAIDGDTVHAVWAEGGRILYRRSADAGMTWSKPVPLTSGHTAEYPCSLELAASCLHLIWPDRRDGSWAIYYKRSADGGVTWGPDTRLTHGVDLFRMGAAASGSTLHIVWASKSLVLPTPGGTHTWGEIYYMHSLDGGRSWEPTMRLTQPDACAMRPAVAASGREVHVAWFDRRDSTRQWDWEVYYKRSTDGGATWGPDVRMTRTPTHTRHPQIVATDQGVVCCIWEDGQVFDGAKWSGDPALYASVSTDHGKSWKAPRRITSINAPHGWATHAKAYSSGRTAYLAWTDAPEGPDRPRAAYYMTSPDGGVTWQEPERLTDASEGEWWAAGVAGADSYAVAVMNDSNALSYQVRRSLPYPPSPVIRGITWHWDTYSTAAPGSDLWPVTWGSDDHLYAAWGDGGGFGGSDSDGRVAMGLARIEGPPDHYRGVNVNGGKNPEHPASFATKGKTGAVVSVEGVIYATVNLEDGRWPDVNHALAWSTDRGATWARSAWVFPKGAGNFQPAKFLQFGKDYQGVPALLAGYVYVYGPKQDARPGSGNRLYLARVPTGRLRERTAYEFFRGLDNAGKPAWCSDSALACPVFTDANGVTPGAVVYNPGINRFLLTCFHVGPGQLGVFDAPDPWGPWTTIAYYEDWGHMGSAGEGLNCEFPQKWISVDGLTLWSVFSVYGEGGKQGIKTHDRFNLVKATLTQDSNGNAKP